MNIALNLPVNPVSFGQVSTLLLKTLFEQEKQSGEKNDIFLFPIGKVDLGSQVNNEDFNKWLDIKIRNAHENYSRDIPIFKLWHFNGSLESLSRHQSLFTFYELDEPTKVELNTAKNNKTIFSSKYSCEIFKEHGINTHYIPLAFDSYNFHTIQKKIHNDDRIVFNVCGKFEKRKHHEKVIQTWISKYGNNPKYALQCSIYNPFLNEEQNKQIIMRIIKGLKPFNVNFYPMMNENSVYNEFLNSADIVLGLSGAEGFGLPEFQSVALGKHAILLNAHAYKDWANKESAVWVEPTGKIPAYDGLFFNKGQPYNQGNIFDFNEADLLVACEKAISRVEKNRINEAGLLLQKTYSKERFLEGVLERIKN